MAAPADLSTLEFWAQTARQRSETFEWLRRHEPVSYHRPVEFGLTTVIPDDGAGFWVVATHDLVRSISRSPDFCSGHGVFMDDAGLPAEMREGFGSFLVMDGPRHATLRRLVSEAFTPRQVARIEAQIDEQSRRTVDHLIEL